MGKYLVLNETDGDYYQKDAVDTSDGAADAGEIPELNADGHLDPSILNAATSGADIVVMTGPGGRLDESLMPVGIGNDAVEIEASEALSANDVINIHIVTGNFRARRADASNGRMAHGYVAQSYALGEQALVYREGTNEGVSGLTGPRVWLAAAPGAVTSTPVTTPGQIQQEVGSAHSATAFYFQRGRVTHLV